MKRNRLRQGNTIYIAEVRFDSDTTRFTYSVIPCSIVLRKFAYGQIFVKYESYEHIIKGLPTLCGYLPELLSKHPITPTVRPFLTRGRALSYAKHACSILNHLFTYTYNND